MMRIIGIATSALLLFAAVAVAEDVNIDDLNVVSSPGSTGVGRNDPSPSSPAVSGSRAVKVESTVSGKEFGDSAPPPPPSQGGCCPTAR